MSRVLKIGGALLGVVAVGLGGLFWSRSAAGEPAPAVTAAAATVPVRQGALNGQVSQTGTLSYAAQADGSDYPIVNQAAGVYTKLPAAGQVVACGRVLYWVDDDPVLLLCGSRPFYRDLAEGDEGWDVATLNKNLRDLGYDADDGDDYTWETAEGLDDLQDDVGDFDVRDAVVLPGPVRIAGVTAQLGGRAAPGTPLGTAVTTRREVVVQLNASQQAQVKVGNKAQITLPDNRVTTGRVGRIGTVATQDKDGSATVPVYLALDKPKEAGTLDAAPVRVQITTAGVKNALIVPVTSLVGVGTGGFAVERVGDAGGRETVPVKLGLFDDSAGMVQVTGDLKAGDRVVVPSS
ncbi:efflux RND transporter periplasmic adaptor subunit [Paractinoplanes globisporus]|uniref:Efflux RND transporter periplasmic adaptor subunit n=1 Tax=Paractinoplanes globisporus TaxID=113565 RepID=A0ABW6WR07_9ACTN|nr:HlyD family secretion protein [Actinoplanes globisporus]